MSSGTGTFTLRKIREIPWSFDPFLLLPVAIFAVDLLSPLLIDHGWMPGATRWLSHAGVVVAMGLAFLRMMVSNHIPGAILPILSLSFMGVLSAALNEQNLLVTLWGWFLLFQFPMVGLFVYLQRSWISFRPGWVTIALVGLLGFELAVQAVQYLQGIAPGDQLSGTFGMFGTGKLALFILLVTALALGRWVFTRDWKMLLFTIAIGFACSLLGETKLYLPAVLVMGGLATLLYVRRNGGLARTVALMGILGGMGILFLKLYGVVIPGGYSFADMLLSPSMLNRYLNFSASQAVNGTVVYDLGRNLWLQFAFNSISGDPATLMFGFGLGSRSESAALGLVGQNLVNGSYGLATGTSLVVMLQEIGVVGMLVVGGFLGYAVIRLGMEIARNPASPLNEIRYGLLIYTLMFPVWLWYNTAWILRAAMVLYWALLGWVLNPAAKKEFDHGG